MEGHTSHFIWENDVFPGFQCDTYRNDQIGVRKRTGMDEEFCENLIYSYMLKGKENVVFTRHCIIICKGKLESVKDSVLGENNTF